MANLVIRPASGAGNKVVVQDQSGAAVLTTADSGATIANATLNSPTLVTPALGTPASGVLTNATFPAGHIVKFEKSVTQPTASQGGSTTYSDLTGSSMTYTPATGATSVVYSCQFHYGGDNSGAEDMPLWHIMYDGTAEYGTKGFTYFSGGGGAWAVGQKTHQYIRAAWSGAKVIKIRQRAYSASTYGWFHRQVYGSTNVATEDGPNTSSNYMKVYTTIYSVM